jgi:acyl-CoA reductase-like NAD-dependent aldehyde dehydrogenase
MEEEYSLANLKDRPSKSRVVAVVDRTADFSQAAKHLIRARFSFKGESPYAPDVVLVNEFCMKDFCNAALQEASRWLSSQVEMNGL